MTAFASPSRSRRFWLGAALAGVVGAFVAGCGRSHHGWHRSGHGMQDVASLEEARDRAHDATDWMLRHFDATDEQRTRIRAIVDESVTQLYPLRERHQRHHLELVEALAQPDVDRAEIERLRKAELELADTASNWLVDAMLDAMEVLTPEQRAELLQHVREKHG